MEESYNSIVEFRIIPECLEKISEDSKVWLAVAISNILISDKQLAPEEKGYFKDAVMMVENEDLQKQLLEAMKNREILELSLIHICRCRRYSLCRSRWSPYH